MTLHISEAEVRAVLTMPMAVEAVEEIQLCGPAFTDKVRGVGRGSTTHRHQQRKGGGA